MTTQPSVAPRTGVILAVAVLLVLSGLLSVRIMARDASPRATTQAPEAAIPAAAPIDVRTLAVPCWSCPEAKDWPLAFRTNLDMLAPLGTGAGNAAEWFVAFRKPDGPRYAEAVAAEGRRVEHPPVGKILPPDDPLLLEAEGWCDQAKMRFYPDILPLEGADTKLPNLLVALTFARSWVARGQQAESFEAAMADFTRVIRLGRLLRQEDVVLISDLVGLACIRIGAEAIFERARTEGRLDLAMVAALVAGEASPQKLLTAARVTSVEVGPYLLPKPGGGHTLTLPDGRLEAIVTMANTCPDRRFRGEAMWDLRIVGALGTPEQATRAKATLEALSRSDDPMMALGARAFTAKPVTPEEVAMVAESVIR